MEKVLEFVDAWMKSQKEFMESWMTSQRDFMEKSSKAFVDETGKIHELWKSAAEKQMDMSRQIIKNYAELFNAASAKK